MPQIVNGAVQRNMKTLSWHEGRPLPAGGLRPSALATRFGVDNGAPGRITFHSRHLLPLLPEGGILGVELRTLHQQVTGLCFDAASVINRYTGAAE